MKIRCKFQVNIEKQDEFIIICRLGKICPIVNDAICRKFIPISHDLVITEKELIHKGEIYRVQAPEDIEEI